MSDQDEELYVLVCERDTYVPEQDSRPIIFEQCIDNGAASLENVRKRQTSLGETYGKTRIAKLQFVDQKQEAI